MRESKPDRFRRVAEARVNKIIKMVRLLGNCSNILNPAGGSKQSTEAVCSVSKKTVFPVQ